MGFYSSRMCLFPLYNIARGGQSNPETLKNKENNGPGCMRRHHPRAGFLCCDPNPSLKRRLASFFDGRGQRFLDMGQQVLGR